MTIETAREYAAKAWCTPVTKDIVMDPTLAEAFANIILTIFAISKDELTEYYRICYNLDS